MKDDFGSFVEGKTVAVVGNAESLFQYSYGKQIDAHDIVVRINKPAIFYDDRPCIESHGEKLDLWVFWDYGHFKNKVDPAKLPPRLNEFFNHGDYKIFSTNMKMTRQWFLWGDPGEPIWEYSRYKLIEENILKYTDKKTRRNPSTGLLFLLTLKHFNPSKVDVYGFDFKRTQTFGEEEQFKNVIHGHRWDMSCCHEFAFEEFVAERELFSDDRFNLKGVHWEREKGDKYRYD